MEHINTHALETARLILRSFVESDLPALFSIFSDREVNRFLPWFPLNTPEEAKPFWEKHYHESGENPFRYAICLKEDNVPVGYVNIGMDDSHDLGYGLRKEFWHRGIVTEAARAMVEFAGRSGLPYITATHDRENPRSGGVMRQLGMRYRYSYEEQWQPKDILVTFRMYQLNLDGREDRIYRKYWNESAVHFVEEGL